MSWTRLLRNKSRLCHCEALFAEAISTPRIGDRFGGKAPPRDDTWSFSPYEWRDRDMEQLAMTRAERLRDPLLLSRQYDIIYW